MSRKQIAQVISVSVQKGWRPSLSMALFGAMGQIIAYSGYGEHFQSLHQPLHIPWALSEGLKQYAGDLYPIFVPVLGWIGTFLTGYGVASLMLFGQLQIQAAGLLELSPTWLSAGLAIGASLGSISSPFKIAIATPMCGAVGKEGDILRWTIPIGVVSSVGIGIILFVVT